MDRRLLFPALAMTAVAQTTSPSNAKSEKPLRARAEEFYQLELKENFRQAEGLVAEDSKDYFYNSGKPKFQDVKVGAIEFQDKGTKALVHLDVKVQLLAPGVGTQVFTAPATSTWKLEKGQWFWYFDKNSNMVTPFGKMSFDDPKPGGGIMDLTGKPSVTSIQSAVSVDRQSVILTAAHPEESVTLSNNLPGVITVGVVGKGVAGASTELSATEVKAGEKAQIHIRRIGNAKPNGTLDLSISPLNLNISIGVKSE